MDKYDEITLAVLRTGRSSTYHRQQIFRLADEWPTLAEAIAKKIRREYGSEYVPAQWKKLL